ncbi:MAG: TIM barrel protein [Planctomycetota bacterium]|nr:TIM barrel protein [Planctomycetota bacterium]
MPAIGRVQPRFGLVTYMWGAGLELPALIALLERTGLEGVELRTTHRHGVEPALNQAQRAEVRARFADSPVTLVGLGSNERFDSLSPTEVGKAVAATTRFLQLSKDVGASGVKVKPDALHVKEGVAVEATLDQIGACLRALGPIARDLGQELRLEAHGQCAPTARLAHILEAADHPAVRLCWNCNAPDLAEPGLAKNFARLRPWFGDTLHTRRLDTDDYPVRDLIELCKSSHYDGWVLLEQGGQVPSDLDATLRDQNERFASLVGDE